MVNVILDTNVLVASLLKPSGVNRQCMLKIFGYLSTFSVCYSSQMMDEYKDVLSRPVITSLGLSSNAHELLNIIRDFSEEVIPKFLPALVYPDHKDKPFLEAAVYVNGILITNNLKDFSFADVHVCGPQEFLDWCKENGI